MGLNFVRVTRIGWHIFGILGVSRLYVYNWPQYRLWWGRGSEIPAVHTQQNRPKHPRHSIDYNGAGDLRGQRHIPSKIEPNSLAAITIPLKSIRVRHNIKIHRN